MSQHVLIALGMPPDLEKFKLSHGVNERLHALLDRQDRGAGLTAAARTEAAGTEDGHRPGPRLRHPRRLGRQSDTSAVGHFSQGDGGERAAVPTAAVDKDSDPYIPCSEIREHFDRCEHLGKHQCAIGLRQV